MGRTRLMLLTQNGRPASITITLLPIPDTLRTSQLQECLQHIFQLERGYMWSWW